MLVQQQKLQLSTYTDLYDLLVPKDNFLRKINLILSKSIIVDGTHHFGITYTTVQKYTPSAL
jgi:hypothetical protein